MSKTMKPMKTKRLTSQLWLYFEMSDRVEKKAKCCLCNQIISYKSSNSNLKTHLRRKHRTAFSMLDQRPKPPVSETYETIVEEFVVEEKPSTSKLIAMSEQRQNYKIMLKNPNDFSSQSNDKTKSDNALLGLFTKDFQPFSLVEEEGFKHFVKALNPSYQLPSRKTISSTMLPLLYENSKARVQDIVRREALTACISIDSWTSKTRNSYLTMTGHYVNNNLEFKSVLLDSITFDRHQTSENLASEMKDIINKWSLTGKINMAVSDNIDIIVNAISKNNWNFFGCYAGKLNLVIDGSLNPIFSDTVDKVKRIVLYYKNSDSATEKLINYQVNELFSEPLKLKQCVPTIWTSVYFMLERFVRLKDPLKATASLIKDDLPIITAEEWEQYEQICAVLEYFETATQKMRSEHYMSGSSAIMIVRGLLSVCEKLLGKNYNARIKEFINKLICGIKEQFQDIEFNTNLAICTFLDPRYKQHGFSHADAAMAIQNDLIELVEQEIKNSTEETMNDGDTSDDESEKDKKRNQFSLWDDFENSIKNLKHNAPNASYTLAQKEVEMYKQHELLDRNACVLTWWRKNKDIYPNLCKIFMFNCNIVVSSVPCEQLYSKVGSIIVDRRTNLKTAKVGQLVFINANSQYNNDH